MELNSFQNKVRLCCAIFTTLIFLDIVAFFDTLGPIFSFRKIQNGSSVPLWPDAKEPSYHIKGENISSSQNYTKRLKTEDVVDGEMVHNVALLLVELLGLAILLVADSYPHILISSYPQILISSYPHILISSYPHISSNPHISSHPQIHTAPAVQHQARPHAGGSHCCLDSRAKGRNHLCWRIYHDFIFEAPYIFLPYFLFVWGFTCYCYLYSSPPNWCV